MNVDEMVTLANGKSYGLLLDAELNKNMYFLAVLLNDKEEPTNEFIVLKEIEENGQLLVSEEKDPLILNKLLEDYREQMEDMDDDE